MVEETKSNKSIQFGCGNQATVIDESGSYKADNGILMKKYLIVPSDNLINDYPWLKGKMARSLSVWVEYPCTLIDDDNNQIKVRCAFDGKEKSEPTPKHAGGRPSGAFNRISPTNVKWMKRLVHGEGISIVRKSAVQKMNDKSEATLKAGCEECKKDHSSKSLRGRHIL